MGKRFFSVAEARRLLPAVRSLTGKMIELSQRLEGFREGIRELSEKSASNAGGPEGTAYIEVLIALRACIGQIQDLGILVKGVQDGLVDFPHLMDGREVYLCWKYGEDDIRFWHEVDSGFAGRTPLGD